MKYKVTGEITYKWEVVVDASSQTDADYQATQILKTEGINSVDKQEVGISVKSVVVDME